MNDQSTNTTAASPKGLIPFLEKNRKPVALTLMFAALLLAVISIILCAKGFATTSKDPSEVDKPKTALEEPADGKAQDAKATTPLKDNTDYRLFGVWTTLITTIFLLGGFWLLNRIPGGADASSMIRIEVLSFLGAVGIATVFLGLSLLYQWSDSFEDWLSKKKIDAATWVFVIFAVLVAGLITIFIGLQFGRADERMNPLLRRLLYGFNAIFMGSLLLIVLIAVNVTVSLSFSKPYVTNDSAFQELEKESIEFVRKVDKPIELYLVLPESFNSEVARDLPPYTGLFSDTVGLLDQCVELNSKISYTKLAPGFDDFRINELMVKLDRTTQDKQDLGIYGIVDGDVKNHFFIAAKDLVELDLRRGSVVYQGERKLMNELNYQLDQSNRKKIYVTQDHGELLIEEPMGDGANKAPGARTMYKFAQAMRERKLAVEVLKLDPKSPKVPDDAALVLVPGPQVTIAETSPTYIALFNYLTKPRADGTYGKMVAFLPAFPGPNGDVAPTGLEPILGLWKVTISDQRRLVSFPRQPFGNLTIAPSAVVVMHTPSTENLITFQRPNALVLNNSRFFTITSRDPDNHHAKRLLISLFRRGTWQETGFNTNLSLRFQQISEDPTDELKKRFLVSGNSYPMAITVRQPDLGNNGKPVGVLFGSDSLIDDQAPVLPDDRFTDELLFSSLSWTTEKTSAFNLAPRKVPVFALSRPLPTSMFLGLFAQLAVGIGVIGLGVWISRRR